MLIDPHGHMQGLLDVRHRSLHIHQQAVGMRADHCQAIRLRKGDDRLIILFGWAEPFRELLRGQVMMKIWAGRVVNLLKQTIKRLLVAQRQPNGQGQTIGVGKAAQRLQVSHSPWHVPMQSLWSRRLGRGCEQEEQDRSGRRNESIHSLVA